MRYYLGKGRQYRRAGPGGAGHVRSKGVVVPQSGLFLDKPVAIARLMDEGVRERPDAPVILSIDESWSWSELEGRSSNLAAHYLGLGLRPGDRVVGQIASR
jgi:non-ribosomal peptide synthetase component E (peptide arylation enzyme)